MVFDEDLECLLFLTLKQANVHHVFALHINLSTVLKLVQVVENLNTFFS